MAFNSNTALTPLFFSSLFVDQARDEDRKFSVPSRSGSRRTLLGRVAAAWRVLCGRADALVWPEDDSATYDACESLVEQFAKIDTKLKEQEKGLEFGDIVVSRLLLPVKIVPTGTLFFVNPEPDMPGEAAMRRAREMQRQLREEIDAVPHSGSSSSERDASSGVVS